MAGTSFAAKIEGWTRRVKEAEEAVFKNSCAEMMKVLNSLVPVGETQFLQSSLQASTKSAPRLNRPNPGRADEGFVGEMELVINSAELGDVLYLGYTAQCGAYVHYGTAKMPGRPWVTLAAQRWQSIVTAAAAVEKARFGL